MHGDKRTVRSFVRRSGRLTASQQRALDEFWPRYGIDFTAQALHLDALFGRQTERVLEIGFGNGETLVQLAAEQPQYDFLGVEVHQPGVGHCLLKAHEADLSNLRLIMHDAIDVLTQQLTDASLHRVNLYFPDPWPKKRHHKRRIVQAGFLDLIASRLQAGGSLHIATDWAPYAEHIDETLAAHPLFDCAERRQHKGDQPLQRPATKFEQRGIRKGHHIVDWRFTKID